MTILDKLQITTPANLADAISGEAYNVPRQASGGTGLTWKLESGLLPDGLSLSSSGVISGTPGAISGSTMRNANISVTDSNSRFIFKSFTIVWRQGIIIQTPANGNPSWVVGSPVSQFPSDNFTVSGGTPPYQWSATGLPTGVMMNASTGILSGIPTQGGRFPPPITPTD